MYLYILSLILSLLNAFLNPGARLAWLTAAIANFCALAENQRWWR